jgi:hypothetical protein
MDHIKIITGGQTGIDRAALDYCLEKHRPCGGWCPEGRMAEDGPISLMYPVKELAGAGYEQRTFANVRDSDATAIFYPGALNGGTLKSYEFVKKEGNPFLLLDMLHLKPEGASLHLLEFVDRYRPGILNISGPRESECPMGYDFCYEVLQQVFGK